MKTTTLILIILVITFIGCKKDDTVKTKSDLLTEKLWVHDYEMVDSNKNHKPDDEKGQQKSISFDFKSDGSLIYTKNQITKQLTWTFENSESSIKVIGIMDDSIIPPVTELSLSVFQLDENNLIFYYMSTVNNPETGTFEIYKH